jgi:hypothetical protein
MNANMAKAIRDTLPSMPELMVSAGSAPVSAHIPDSS